jgi:general secretion pathway protein A
MYNEYFGFLRSPFSATPDSRIFYDNELYQEAFANLRYGIEWQKGLIVMTGEVGTGKTTLLDKIVRNLGPTIQVVFVSYDQLDSGELIQLIYRKLGLASDVQDRITSIEQLRDYLNAQSRRRRIVALLIDEAQNLSDETFEAIRFLSNFESGGEKLLQIVLTGQPELETRLNQSKLRHLKQRIVIHCRLTPLTNDEVSRYIYFRLRGAGFRGKDLFNAEVIGDISLYSGGIPRLINIICDNALLLAYAGAKKTITTEIVQEVVRDLGLANVPEAKPSTDLPEAATLQDSGFLSLVEPAAPRLQRRSRRLTWVPMGMALALVALGGAAATLYSSQIKGYLAQVPSPETQRITTQYAYQNRSVTFNTSEPELSFQRRESVARDRSEPENLATDRLSPPPLAPHSEQSQPQESAPKKKDPRLGVFEIVGGSSFLRGSPGPDAKIVATLEPSTRVKVVSARGDYLQVQTVFEGKTIRGYVHREDALFERPKKDK